MNGHCLAIKGRLPVNNRCVITTASSCPREQPRCQWINNNDVQNTHSCAKEELEIIHLYHTSNCIKIQWSVQMLL